MPRQRVLLALPRQWVLLALAVLAVLAVSLVSSAAATASGTSNRLIREINSVRHHHGLRGVRQSPSLGRSAGRYAHHLIRADLFQHASRIRASSRFRRLGEILALNPGWRPRTRRVVANWLRSPVHRSVILNPTFHYAGAGRARGRFGASRATIWTVQFGAR